MGRYNFAAQRVHQAATRLLEVGRIKAPPPWYNVIGTLPPSERLVRPALGRPNKRKKASRLFQPLQIKYPEDQLREEFYGDHPWELARPRVVLENDGKDYQRYDWSKIEQPGKQLDGESVVQRQQYLMEHGLHPGYPLDKAAAYDQARKEFYDIRHFEDVERRVAKEEALATGAYFGKGPLEVGMELEDKKYEEWKAWAIKESAQLRQASGAAYSGTDNPDAMLLDDGATQAGLDELEPSVPRSKAGQTALGGAVMHP